MDLESTLATVAASLPETITQTITDVASYFPEELRQVIRHARNYIPHQIDLESAALFMLYFAAASLVMGIIGRVVLGKRSSLNHSLSSAMGIFFVYAATIVAYTFKPWNLDMFLSPLPFVTFSGEYLIVFPIMDTQFPALCTQVLSLIILAFLVNLLDTFIPQGESLISWYLLRFVMVVLAIGLHFWVTWAFRTYLPEVLVTYAPTILLLLLAVMLLSGIFSLVVGLVIAVSNPFLGAMYTFFFSSLVGKQLSKAVFSSAILMGVFWLLEYVGYVIISISAAALLAYIPLGIILLILWYLIGHLL